ncbi:MAG TPA: hypothetical protein ENN60_00760 [archaeon]|nr:hypothetical protein [archaeon]
MKLCPRCGRVLKRKRWVKPTPAEQRHAGTFEPFQKEICDDCTRRPEAHNAILQIRGIPADEVEALVARTAETSVKKGRREAWFRKKEDFRFTSKAMARQVAAQLKAAGAELKESSKLVTWDQQGSRPLLRLTISARFTVVAGDLVQTPRGPDVVSRVSGGWVWTRGGKKFRVKEAKRLEAENFKGMVISERPPMVTVTETGESVEVEGGLAGCTPGQEVRLRFHEGRWWVV